MTTQPRSLVDPSTSRSRHTLLGAALILALAVLPVAGTPVTAEPIETCDRSAVELPASPEATAGTTFTGTYQGDLMHSTSGGDHLLDSYWSVDRVYAGGPLPRDLVTTTPDCAWANLTPGVRYLFSTAAADIALDPEQGATDATGQPAVSNSAAWAIGSDDSLTLAPFDTYAVADYPAAFSELVDLSAAHAVLAADAGTGSEPGPKTQAGVAGDTGVYEPPLPSSVQGTTFVARFIGEERLPGSSWSSYHDTRSYWHVERVYAGGPLPEVLTIRSGSTFPPSLDPGRRYLVSTADALAMGPWNTLAWRLKADGEVALAPYGGKAGWGWRPETGTIKTLDEALAAVAPRAGDGEVPERAGDRTPG